MIEIKVLVTAPELAQAINNLAAAMSGSALQTGSVPSAPPAPAAMPNPVPSPAATAPAAPPAPIPVPVPVPAVPLAATPAFTAEQLAHAGADLVTRHPEKAIAAQELLRQFGAASVMELPPERYGEFATALRGLGANI